MPKLIFSAAAMRRVVEHSINAPKQSEVADYSACKGGKWQPKTVVPKKATVILVHDHGVYFMSNGSPRDIIDPAKNASFCAYAEGCNPKKDGNDWYDNARSLVGGDDFGEYLEWADEIKKMVDAGATHIVVNFSQRRLSLTAKYPKGHEPKGDVVPETPDQMAKRIKRLMRTKVVGFDTKTRRLVSYKAAPTAAMIESIQKKQPGVIVLNGKPEFELHKAVNDYFAMKAAEKV